MSHLVIAGLGGGVQPRLEINNFVHDDRQFSLYVQALNKMYADDQSNVPSYFQVAGIHGLPFTAWDGASTPGFTADPNQQWAGYCTHGSTLFPTWHRPYVMLIEQILSGYAQQIAATYAVDKDAWKQAATNMRQPFWDWAQNSVPPPQIISMQQVEITAPSGRRSNVTNPLMRYRFHPIDGSFYYPYSQWQTTLRRPASTNRGATDNVSGLISVLKNAQRGITESTYAMLTRVTGWSQFSSHTTSKGGNATNSLEAIHDNIHVLIGGNGHMSDPAVAAFDPIFWLHHANVDRMVSLWSAINPDVWTANGDAQDGTYTLVAGQSVNVNTPLTPFWNSQTSFWLSSQVRSTSSLGYTYPEFQGLDMNNKQAVRDSIIQKVNQLYNGQKRNTKRTLEVTAAETAQGHARRHRLLSRSLMSQLISGTYSDWTARIAFNRRELGRSFSVLLFIGDAPEDPKEWLTCQNLVGAHHAFVHNMGDCPSCPGGDLTEEGFVHMNSWIAEHSVLGSFELSVIGPFLKQGLQWRVINTDGTPVTLSSLEVSVYEVPLSMPPGANIPIIGDIKLHGDITHGRPGGCSSD
ncbi:polyphenol oxidase [Macrolepiota fuliginosa MF-IS2]|uniref:tyrosinase n=1 Tax=Macrolepiota fuliginosa MF-IS2 TaxID=1400762 RepID=A0A9P6BY48_9AGAR|nr:polyphenol oxidase [Macrolepiota fuliginosa MF-IS2]